MCCRDSRHVRRSFGLGPRKNDTSSGLERRLRSCVKVLPGGYSNLLAGATRREPQKALERTRTLIEAKRRYDPDNVFRSAIPLPASEAGHIWRVSRRD